MSAAEEYVEALRVERDRCIQTGNDRLSDVEAELARAEAALVPARDIAAEVEAAAEPEPEPDQPEPETTQTPAPPEKAVPAKPRARNRG